MSKPEIRLVVFDLGGTTVDYGCFGPVAAFVQVFAEEGVTLSTTQARGPMGLHKKDHIRALFQLAEVTKGWQDAHGRVWNESDVDRLYRRFIPLQLEVIEQHSKLVPGLLDCVEQLRRLDIRIGTTTGYFREAAERVHAACRSQGFIPDLSLSADDVPAGRPAPWMMFRIMEKLNVYPSDAVLKVGDTVPDIEEGLNAGAWSVGVTLTSSEIGCSESEWAALSFEDQRARLKSAEQKLYNAGAHRVCESLSQLPAIVTRLNGCLRDRESVIESLRKTGKGRIP